MILPDNTHFPNISLIGMAGAGKSTIGPPLAKRLAAGYLDTDDLIEAAKKKPLQEVVDEIGLEQFQVLEEQVICSVAVSGYVIATGGSAVYSKAAMLHLQKCSRVIWLDVPLRELKQRVGNVESRGLVNPMGSSFSSLFRQRYSLYEHYADIRIRCTDRQPTEIVSLLVRQLEVYWKKVWKGLMTDCPQCNTNRIVMVENLPDDIKDDLIRAATLHERTASDYAKCVEFNSLMSNLLARLEDGGFYKTADRIMTVLIQCNPREGCHCEHSIQVSQKMKKFT